MHTSISHSSIKHALSRKLKLEASGPATLESEHKLVEAVLAQIEHLADALPSLPPQATLDVITTYLREAIPAHCREEEAILAAKGSTFVAALNLLRSEHSANDAVAAELADMLDDCAGLTIAPTPEALGLVARQYFMIMRRHMAWEELIMAKSAAMSNADPFDQS